MKTLTRQTKHFSLDFESAFYNFSTLVNHDAQIFNELNNPELVIGLDEVGRGCVAGPIYTAAYSCSDFYTRAKKLLKTISYYEKLLDEKIYSLLLLNDSKKVAHNYRSGLCQSLLNIPSQDNQGHIFHSIASKTAKNVDQEGIIECLWQCMAQNVNELIDDYKYYYQSLPKSILLLVDGRHCIPDLQARLHQSIAKEDLDQISIQQKNIIKGDNHSALIAAASNLAKNARDEYMKSKKDKDYGWNTNVGYGTKKHLEAIKEKGLSKEHRKSFLKNYSYSDLSLTSKE